ncbi:RNA polymerase I enhancer binding protein [Mortierella polycephala]|uniref:RNA polymerase I enhancer binding protein n=1 Tax=Mortierella polycephala TaxID=41804 RepID=A0A9P6TVF2_9FUNG|nr:RNA polymerase I enhancer binding protein [Mortierella polycephala]
MEQQPQATRKRKNSDEALHAGFKKALVSSATNFRDVLDTLGQADHDSVGSTDADVEAANAAVLTTMADLLASAGESSSLMQHSNQSGHQHDLQSLQKQQHHHHDPHQQQQDTRGVSEDVLRMQQQLQQQIPLETSSGTQLTREQIMESMTNIPTMQMLIEESLKRDLGASRGNNNQNQPPHSSSSPHQSSMDATSVLVDLGDPSILATLKPAISHSAASQSAALPENSAQSGRQGNGRKRTRTARRSSNADLASTGSTSNSSSSGNVGAGSDQGQGSGVSVVTSDNPLHTKWLMATALKEKGIAYKTGTFSSHEDEMIRETIKDYVARNNMPEDAIQRWFENGNGRGRFEKNDLKALWVEIAARLQNRPLLNIYLHVRRMFHPQNNVGAWSKDDDQKLVMLYEKHKGQWTTIGMELGRMADSCRDRYRNHLKDLSTMVTGPWQPHEDEKLLTIMQDLALQQGKTSILDSSPMWTLISERMQGTRTRHQCRHRYSQTLQPRLERGEWTAPSSAAAAAAAAVAANTVTNTTSSVTPTPKQPQKQKQKNRQSQQGQQQQQEQQEQQQPQLQLHNQLELDLDSNHDQTKSPTPANQDVLMLAAALQGVLPNHGNDNLLWTQAMTTNMQGSDDGLHNGDDHHLSPEIHHDQNDPFTAAAIAAAASLPLPTIVPKAPKGPIRRRSGLQQQLDVLKIIQDDGYTDHTDIKWWDIAQRLRDRVEGGNAIQLARIIQTHDQLDSRKQQHLQDGDSAATASAAASAAMAAAVSAAQAEAVACLQRVPAANQIARTFMSTRCKIEGYKDMTLQQVIVFMMKDVERRIQHRRGGPLSTLATESANSNEEESTSKSPRKTISTAALLQQQEINDAAQQAAIAALSAQFPELEQHHQQQQQLALAQALTSSSTEQQQQQQKQQQQQQSTSQTQPLEEAPSTLASVGGADQAVSQPSPTAQQSPKAYQTLQRLSAEQQAQHQQDLEQQQHNRDLAEQMLNVAFANPDLDTGSVVGSVFSSPSPTPSSIMSPSLDGEIVESGTPKQATRRVFSDLKPDEMMSETEDEGDDDGGEVLEGENQ